MTATDDLYRLDRWMAGDDVRANEDRAAEARHGGRYYTLRLAAMTPQIDRLPRLLAGAPDDDLDRYARETAARMTSGESRWTGSYSHAPRYRTWEVVESDARRSPTLPESAFDWPIYRAAMAADTLAALHGQACDAEDAILDTLAHCAGIAR